MTITKYKCSLNRRQSQISTKPQVISTRTTNSLKDAHSLVLVLFFDMFNIEQTLNHDGKRYILVLDYPLTWADAETACVNKGGHLASIQSDDEAAYFNSYAANR